MLFFFGVFWPGTPLALFAFVDLVGTTRFLYLVVLLLFGRGTFFLSKLVLMSVSVHCLWVKATNAGASAFRSVRLAQAAGNGGG